MMKLVHLLQARAGSREQAQRSKQVTQQVLSKEEERVAAELIGEPASSKFSRRRHTQCISSVDRHAC